MSTTQSRNHHWKMVMNPKNEGESTLSMNGNKRKFTPLKDNSMRDSKIFQKSRQRSNSSFAVLNRSRDIQTVSVKDKKIVSKLTDGKTPHPQSSVLISAIKPSQFKSIESVQQAKMQFSALTQLQKEFKIFKQKVLKLLQRQQQQIHHLAKQILSACTLEMSKFHQNDQLKQCPKCKFNTGSLQQNLNHQNSHQDILEINQTKKSSKVKQIEDIKHQLNVKINKSQSPFKNHSKPQEFQTPKQIPKINFQQIYSKFANVFDIFKKLNQDKLQMQQVVSSLPVQQNPVQSPRKNKVFSRKPNISK